jgi:hypothetical protein
MALCPTDLLRSVPPRSEAEGRRVSPFGFRVPRSGFASGSVRLWAETRTRRDLGLCPRRPRNPNGKTPGADARRQTRTSRSRGRRNRPDQHASSCPGSPVAEARPRTAARPPTPGASAPKDGRSATVCAGHTTSSYKRGLRAPRSDGGRRPRTRAWRPRRRGPGPGARVFMSWGGPTRLGRRAAGPARSRRRTPPPASAGSTGCCWPRRSLRSSPEASCRPRPAGRSRSVPSSAPPPAHVPTTLAAGSSGRMCAYEWGGAGVSGEVAPSVAASRSDG